jgi:hypothetical protein
MGEPVKSVIRARIEVARRRPAKPQKRFGARLASISLGKRSRPYLPQVAPADPIAGAVPPFSENATLVNRDNRCDLVGYDIEELIADGPSDFALPLG